MELELGSNVHCYFVPKVATSAQQVTGIFVSNSGPMMVNGEPTVHKLMTWIEGFPIVILTAVGDITSECSSQL